jgi:hypothetical protein
VAESFRSRLTRWGFNLFPVWRGTGARVTYARFVLEQAELDEIRRLLGTESAIDRVDVIDLADAAGTVHATVEKAIYVRRNA